MEMEDIDGPMEENIVVIGFVIRCMDKAYLLGVMAGNMKDNITMIRNKVTVFSRGPTAGNTTATG